MSEEQQSQQQMYAQQMQSNPELSQPHSQMPPQQQHMAPPQQMIRQPMPSNAIQSQYSGVPSPYMDSSMRRRRMPSIDEEDEIENFRGPSDHLDSKEQPKSNRKWWWIIGGVVLLLALFALYWFWWRKRGSSSGIISCTDGSSTVNIDVNALDQM
jgi:hypothetical protein